MGDGVTRIAVRDLAILQLKKRATCKCVYVRGEGRGSNSITTAMGCVQHYYDNYTYAFVYI